MNIALIVGAAGFALWGAFALADRAGKKQRMKDAVAAPFSSEWSDLLSRNLPPYDKLPSGLRDQLHDYIKIFLVDKSFEGCGGLVLDDEIKVTIAAQACMLLLNRNTDCYRRLRSVLVYPSTYVAKDDTLPNGSARLGESWTTGVVVLAWNSVKQGAVNFDDGHNVTMHEFAHQLDQADGVADGAPRLAARSAYRSWAKTLSKEYAALQKKAKGGKRSVMDEYGATNPAEFFAVATETFFEKPEQLKKKHPELYEELAGHYKVNPEEWV